MAFDFATTEEKFWLEYRNGVDFDEDVSDFTTYLVGNEGDRVKRSETIEVEISYNKSLIKFLVYNGTGTSGILATVGTDFIEEGLFVGATIQVIQGGNSGESTVEIITGPGNGKIYLDKTNLGFLTDGGHYDIVIYVKDEPTYGQWRYGLIRSDVVGSGDENYNSILDGNPQAYYVNSIGLIFGEMPKMGGFNSWNKTESLLIRFVSTTEYTHTYDIVHIFRIGHYLDGELENLETLVPPDRLAGTYTLKYASRLSLGNSPSMVAKTDRLGVTGDVGYFDENYNGKPKLFEINTIDYDNSIDSGTIDNVNNTDVIINLTSATNLLSAGMPLIIGISLLPSETAYSNKTATYDQTFVLDSIKIDSDEVAANSDVLTDVAAVYVGADDLNITFTTVFSAADKLLILGGSNFIIWITVGEVGLTVPLENTVNLRQIGLFSIDTSIYGLLDHYQCSFYDSNAAYGGSRVYSNHAGWDTDFLGFVGTFNLTQYTGGEYSTILSILSEVILVSQTDVNDVRIINSYPIPFATTGLDYDDPYLYQVVNTSFAQFPNIPSSTSLSAVVVQSLPPFAGASQTFTVIHSFRIDQRDWIPNSEIPMSFYDETEPNDNRNNKTSNYSDIGGYDIYHRLLVEVEHNTPIYPDDKIVPDPLPFSYPLESETQTHELRSDIFEISELDVDPDGNFTNCEIEIYDVLGTVVPYVSVDDVNMLKCIFNQDIGTLDVDNLWGEIIAVRNSTSLDTWQLHSSKDWSTIPGNPLSPSDELGTGNTQFVEIESELNLVHLYCETNPDFIEEGESWNFYARLGKKTTTGT